jgi:hypothetical protein
MTQTSPVAHEDTTANLAGRSVVLRDGVSGMLARGLLVTAVMALATGLLLLLRNQGWAFSGLQVPVLAGISLVIWSGMMLGVFFSEYPRGDEAAFSRLGLATFCRTGIPLLVVLVAVNYATRLNSVALYVAVLYGVGLMSSLALDLTRLGFPRLTQPSE